MHQPPPPVVVVLVTKKDCPACHEFRPRFFRAIHWFPALPWFEQDVETRDPEVNAFFDRAGVRFTPSVLIAPHGPGKIICLEPPITDWQLSEHFADAARHL